MKYLTGIAMLILGTALAPAEDRLKILQVQLQAPLSTIVDLGERIPAQLQMLEVSCHITEAAPDDLYIGAWLSDAHGNWFQSRQLKRLQPGGHHLRFALDAQALLCSEGHAAQWDSLQASLIRHGGVFFISQEANDASFFVHSWQYLNQDQTASTNSHRLTQLSLPLNSSGQWHTHTGQRTQLSFLPDPLPSNPFADSAFRAEVHFRHQASGEKYVIPAFWKVPQLLRDRGHKEEAIAQAGGAFYLRFRPRLPGTYHAEIHARWHHSKKEGLTVTLPSLQVSGRPWDDYVRVDQHDPRFFSVDGEFFWPIGINYHSITDIRGQERIGHPATPIRGSQSYEAYLRRLAAAGGTAAEIWMSNWNLALEWREDWPGFKGLGHYAQGNAARLDAILDLAYELGIRINLVINNHGQVSERTNREWDDNPYHINNGGFLQNARDYFRDQQAHYYQQRYRRYLVARYADHPAILGWKLSSEINLTAGGRQDLRTWHEQASQHLAEIDAYNHPITTHWSGDYRTPDRVIVQQEGMDYVCINAYIGGNRNNRSLVQHLWLSTQDTHRGRGLGRYGKPILVTEYGGSHMAASRPQLVRDHSIGPWVALVAGHAGSPMFWWFEWIDQHDLWRPYHAVSQFLSGDDLRDSQARSAIFATPDPWWASAWVRPGYMLGYVVNNTWADGADAGEATTVTIPIGNEVRPGRMQLQWWCADSGTLLAEQHIQHQGGPLDITATDIRTHLAFKLWRPESADDYP